MFPICVEQDQILLSFQDHKIESGYLSILHPMSLKLRLMMERSKPGTWDAWIRFKALSKPRKGIVSALLSFYENVFVSGSCPDNPMTFIDKAEVTFWDLRQLMSYLPSVEKSQ